MARYRPDGVNKATGLERVRAALGIPRERVFTAGDGRNDIDMLEWTVDGGGVGVAMGQAPEEVLAVANHVTGSDLEDGLAAALSRHSRVDLAASVTIIFRICQGGLSERRWSQS